MACVYQQAIYISNSINQSFHLHKHFVPFSYSFKLHIVYIHKNIAHLSLLKEELRSLNLNLKRHSILQLKKG